MRFENATPYNLLQVIENRINAYISASDSETKSIKAVYLFGSVLDQKKFKEKSDIDLAFLMDHSIYKQDPLTASAPAYMAATEVGLLLKRQTDVIILNSASVETAYWAVTTGKMIYEADHDERVEYEAAIRGLYFDFKPFLEHLRRVNKDASSSDWQEHST